MTGVISDMKTQDYHCINELDDLPTFPFLKTKRILTIHGKTSEMYTLFTVEMVRKRPPTVRTMAREVSDFRYWSL